MSSLGHNHEDQLLELAYGELAEAEARALEAHVQGCAQCAEVLASIRGVRKTLGQLPAEPAPEAGLDSLLAYAEQAARRAAAGPAPRRTWWRRGVVPLVGTAALGLVAVIALQLLPKAQDLTAPRAPPTEAQPVAGEAPVFEAPSQGMETQKVAADQPPQVAQALSGESAQQLPGRVAGAGTRGGARAQAYKREAAKEEAKKVQLEDRIAAPARPAEPSPLAAAPEVTRQKAAVALAPKAAAPPAPEGGLGALGIGERDSVALRAGGTSGGTAEASSASRKSERSEEAAFGGASPEAEALLSQARVAQQAGELRRALALLDQAERSGAAGGQRAELLRRQVEVLVALGEEQRAERVYRQLAAEFPESGAARLAAQRLDAFRSSKASEQRAPPARPAPSAPVQRR